MKITLEIGSEDYSEGEISLLLRDALSEFIDIRTPTKNYVEFRHNYIPTQEGRLRKVLQVENRIKLAKEILSAEVSVNKV